MSIADTAMPAVASEAWERLEPKLLATSRRVNKLESEPDRRHSLICFKVERNSPYVEVDGERLLMMSGYSYLGLSGDERIVAAAKAAVELYGTGCHGVRLLAGSLPIHRELEAAVARFAERPAALVFGSGYAANAGTIAAICGPGDSVIIDKSDHASITDGCRLSGATVTRFRHNDPNDLDRRLRLAGGSGVRLVVVDSVYSMDGDIAPLPELRQVCDAHGALLMVDEAHAVGVIGPAGRGIEDHFGNFDLVDIKMGTLSKGIPSVGGWVAGRRSLVDFLKYNARPFVFSGALPPAQAAAALEALRILESEPERVAHVQSQASRLRAVLGQAGIAIGRSETAIIPLIAGSDERAYDFATSCRHEGIVALPVVSPAVATGFARLRVAVTASHSADHVDIAASAFVKAARRCRLLADRRG